MFEELVDHATSASMPSSMPTSASAFSATPSAPSAPLLAAGTTETANGDGDEPPPCTVLVR
jgi:hypothetical protein